MECSVTVTVLELLVVLFKLPTRRIRVIMAVILMKLQRWRKILQVRNGFMVDLTTWKMFKFIVAMINTALKPVVVIVVVLVVDSVNSAMIQSLQLQN